MNRAIVGGILTALLYPFVNVINGWFGAISLIVSPALVLLSLTAGVITSVFFKKLLASAAWKLEANRGYRFTHLLFLMFKITAVFVLVVLAITAMEVLLGARLPAYYAAFIRALATVAGVSSFAAMALVCLLMQEPVSKPASLWQK